MPDVQKLIAEARRNEHWELFPATGRLLGKLADALEAATAGVETHQETWEALTRAVGEVVFNAANHPVPHVVLGRDISKLREKIVDAILEAGFTRQVTPWTPAIPRQDGGKA